MKLPSQRQYPKTVNVGPEVYKVKFVRKIEGDENILGLCDPESRVISIRLRQSPEGYLKTFIHETLHAFEFEGFLEVKHKQVYALEEAIYSFLVNNL